MLVGTPLELGTAPDWALELCSALGLPLTAAKARAPVDDLPAGWFPRDPFDELDDYGKTYMRPTATRFLYDKDQGGALSMLKDHISLSDSDSHSLSAGNVVEVDKAPVWAVHLCGLLGMSFKAKKYVPVKAAAAAA